MIDDRGDPPVRQEEQRYSSFLVRCWNLSDGKTRIKVQHVQSAESIGLTSFEEVVRWMETQCRETGAGTEGE